MNVIVGIFNSDGRPVGCGTLERMAESIPIVDQTECAYGPRGAVSLGYLMLRTTLRPLMKSFT